MRKLLFPLFLFYIFFPVLGAEAVSTSIKPKSLEIEARFGKKTQAEMLVTNSGDEPTIYQVYPDAYNKNIIVSPTDFRLEPNGHQLVTITTLMWRNNSYNLDLSVIARPLDPSGPTATAGIKIPLSINVVGWQFYAFMLLALTILGALFYYVIKKLKINSIK